jgi:hypothetical protein
MHFKISRPEKEKKHSPVRRRPPHLPAHSAFSSAFVVENVFLNKLYIQQINVLYDAEDIV